MNHGPVHALGLHVWARQLGQHGRKAEAELSQELAASDGGRSGDVGRWNDDDDNDDVGVARTDDVIVQVPEEEDDQLSPAESGRCPGDEEPDAGGREGICSG